MEIDSVIRLAVIALLSAGMFLGWLLLLAGNSALQRICVDNCRALTGFTWWIVWAQFFIFLASLPVQMGRLAPARNGLLAIIAVLAVIEMLQADRLLTYKDSGAGHASRINATVAGHSVLAAFNLLSILFLGFVTFDDVEPNEDDDKDTYNQKHVPMPPASYNGGGHHMKPMTSRASSMRASSPPASEASYPAVPVSRR